MIGGFQAWTVFEEANPGDKSQFTVIGLWSPKLAKLAESIYFGNFFGTKNYNLRKIDKTEL